MFLAILLGAALGAPAGQAPAPSPSAPPSPAVGDSVASFEAKMIDGSSRRIGYEKGSTTVLLFFLSSCPHCHRMLPLWNDAYARKPKDLDVVGVILDTEPLGWWSLNPVSFPVVRSPDRAFLNAYKIFRVPVTMRVVGDGGTGHVEDVIVSEADAMRLGELFRPPAPPARPKK